MHSQGAAQRRPGRRCLSGLIVVLGIVLARGVVAGAPAPANTPAAAPKPSVEDLWVIPHDQMNPAEQVVAQTLQGLVNRQAPKIWIEAGGMSAVILKDLEREGTKLHRVASVWDLVRKFRPAVQGVIVYQLGASSLNVATSLCGLRQGVAVDESLMARAKAEGLTVLADTRGKTERDLLAQRGGRFVKGIIVEQTIEKPGFLRDFAVARGAFVYSGVDSALRIEIARMFGPTALVFGWGDNEYQWFKDVSMGGASGVAADWCVNLSAMQGLPVAALRRKVRPNPAPPRAGERIVAFVLTDGDNIQWLCGGMPLDPKYFGSPLRGQFPMTWEVSPVLGRMAPRVLAYLYAHATDKDSFLAAGHPGISFLHFLPDVPAAAVQTAEYLRRSDLSVVGVLNDNDGRMEETFPLLDLPHVRGVVYKDYAPYHRRQGAVVWRGGKPCMAYRFCLWEGLGGCSVDEVAAAIRGMPASPRTDAGSYALVTVHAWSFGGIGGPLEAVKRTIAALPPHTRVVTADDLLLLLKNTLGPKGGAAGR